MPGATDNYAGNLGTGGENYASDSIGSVHFPRVKIGVGADGAATDVSASNPMPVSLTSTQVDVHGQTLGVSRVVQVTAKFFQQAPSNFLNLTLSGGATATGPTAGLAVFATGTATTAALLGQTPIGVMYATQYEAWASLAGSFTTPTSAASFQRLGIYDAVNGYFFGYSGLTFGLTVRANSVSTFVAQASWNRDGLTGAAGSRFTSNGAPVALVPTNMNMWRIRYGWYGAVTARYEVYSPDGEWVLVHQVRTANSQTGANITGPDLPMAVEVSKTAADATNLVISCGGWGAGITSAASGATLSGHGAIAALNAVVAVPTTSVGELSFSITGTWVGTLSFQYSLDGLAWTADSPLNNVTGGFASSTTVNGAFTAPVGSYKFYRIVATAWTSGSASVVYNASPTSSVVTTRHPSLTKGTQGATGVTTQDLKDAGRNQVTYFMVTPVLTAAADALQSLAGYKSGAAVAATLTPAVVTTGKTFRLQFVTLTFVTTAAAGNARFTLRANTAGLAAIGSPAVTTWYIGGNSSATAGLVQQFSIAVPDGMEFAGGTGLGISLLGQSATMVATATGYAQISLHGYEY